jgi:hypothetical protein
VRWPPLGPHSRHWRKRRCLSCGQARAVLGGPEDARECRAQTVGCVSHDPPPFELEIREDVRTQNSQSPQWCRTGLASGVATPSATS